MVQPSTQSTERETRAGVADDVTRALASRVLVAHGLLSSCSRRQPGSCLPREVILSRPTCLSGLCYSQLEHHLYEQLTKPVTYSRARRGSVIANGNRALYACAPSLEHSCPKQRPPYTSISSQYPRALPSRPALPLAPRHLYPARPRCLLPPRTGSTSNGVVVHDQTSTFRVKRVAAYIRPCSSCAHRIHAVLSVQPYSLPRGRGLLTCNHKHASYGACHTAVSTRTNMGHAGDASRRVSLGADSTEGLRSRLFPVRMRVRRRAQPALAPSMRVTQADPSSSNCVPATVFSSLFETRGGTRSFDDHVLGGRTPLREAHSVFQRPHDTPPVSRPYSRAMDSSQWLLLIRQPSSSPTPRPQCLVSRSEEICAARVTAPAGNPHVHGERRRPTPQRRGCARPRNAYDNSHEDQCVPTNL